MRKQVLLLALIILAGTAWGTPKFARDPSGNLYQFEMLSSPTGEVQKVILTYARSFDQGRTYSKPQKIYAFSSEVESWDIKVDLNNSFPIVYTASSELFYFSTSSQAKPISLAKGGSQPSLSVQGTSILAAWEGKIADELDRSGKVIYVSGSNDNGLNWGQPELIQITGESLSSPVIAADNLQDQGLIFLSDNKSLKQHKLYFTKLGSPEPKVIFASHDDIINPRIELSAWGPLINWQSRYANRTNDFRVISLDLGQHFGRIKDLSAEADSALRPPLILKPDDKFVTNNSSFEVTCQTGQTDPIIARVEVSKDSFFAARDTLTYDSYLMPSSAETSFRLPFELDDGRYFLRLAIFDGLQASLPAKPISFTIDSRPPEITLVSPISESSDDDEITLEGILSKPAFVFLNSQPITSVESTRFKASYLLKGGVNKLNLSATDEAGNSAQLVKLITYSAVNPKIRVLKPKDADWYRPLSTIFFEARVSDPQNDIEDETEAEIEVNGQRLKERLTYNKEAGKLSGFITLPEALNNGIYPARVSLRDQSGNLGEKSFSIDLDSQPPFVQTADYFVAASDRITLPVHDEGSGMDPLGTQLKIAGVSFEVLSSGEADLTVGTRLPLPDGSYEVQVLPRDSIGNTGEARVFSLIVDSIPPKLSVAPIPTETENASIIISGEAEDKYLDQVNIYDNNRLVDFFAPISNPFSRSIRLSGGNNKIMIEAKDKAGNKATSYASVFAKLQSAAAVFNKFSYAPNPFSLTKDRQMFFFYSLTNAADLKAYIFDLTGTLIWRKELKNSTSGSMAWDGFDQFGRIAPRGLYPFIFSATYSDQTEVKRGKVILF